MTLYQSEHEAALALAEVCLNRTNTCLAQT